MQAVTTIGLDIAKSVFQIHGVDAAGNVIVRRRLKRRYVLPFFQRLPPCLVWHRSMCVVPSLVARIAGSWSYGAPDAAGLREALRQATQERCRRR
jgi:transposase